MNINVFIEDLANTKVSPTTFNQYTTTLQNNYNRIRRCNLHLYLEHMAKRQPQFMLIGEAPGYRGARLTGIPFVSPNILTKLPYLLGIRSLEVSDEWPHIQREASATMMWEILGQVTAVPLIWNVYPFHPHKPKKLQSNRRPTQKEITQGQSFLENLCTIFPIQTVIAVGNTAANALNRWNIPHEKIRHPSHGGKQAFQSGLFNLLCS